MGIASIAILLRTVFLLFLAPKDAVRKKDLFRRPLDKTSKQVTLWLLFAKSNLLS